MQRSRLAAAVAALTCAAGVSTAADAGESSVVPLPVATSLRSGYFSVEPATPIWAGQDDTDAAAAAQYLAGMWSKTNHLSVAVVRAKWVPARAIEFRRVAGLPSEGYRIDVSAHRTVVAASTAAGLFYGAVTLWQLLPLPPAASRIAAQHIEDAPRYGWRGLMLDSVRHFQSAEFVQQMIDWMAWHKLNVLQWHLSDDQGWRLEILRYPKLTTVGASRTPAAPAGFPAPLHSYSGFYTQQQVRDVVAFAASRHVLVVPEIEMPGHAQAAIAAYPELGVDSPHLPVSSRWGVHTHLFNVEPATFSFLENVLDEVLALFPSPYIHVGGDEAVKDEWRASATVRARAQTLGITDMDSLQAYFTQTIGRYLSAHGRRLVGWDEILAPGLSRDAVVMSWRGVNGAHAAALAGNDTVLSPSPTLYFDYRQSEAADEPPGRLTLATLKGVYEFATPDPALSPAQHAHLLGVQANIWTEHIQTERRVEWMSLPRAAALAEVGWSQTREWPAFLNRLVALMPRYQAFGLDDADSEFAPQIRASRRGATVAVTLATPAEAAAIEPQIRFTLGSEPGAGSPTYRAPIVLQAGQTLRAATFVGSHPASRERRLDVDEHTGRRHDSHELELCSNGIGLLLEPPGAAAGDAPLALDIMNPCWILRHADLSHPLRVTAAVAALPFNYEIGAAAAQIRVGDARSHDGELEVHVDDCNAAPAATLPLAPAIAARITVLEAASLPAQGGVHDVCLRFARPHLDPLWGLAWVELAP